MFSVHRQQYSGKHKYGKKCAKSSITKLEAEQLHLPMIVSVPTDIYLCILQFHFSYCLSFHGSLGQVQTLLSKPLGCEHMYLQTKQIPGLISQDCYVIFSAELTGIASLMRLQILNHCFFQQKLRGHSESVDFVKCHFSVSLHLPVEVNCCFLQDTQWPHSINVFSFSVFRSYLIPSSGIEFLIIWSNIGSIGCVITL